MPLVRVSALCSFQCFDTDGCMAGRTSGHNNNNNNNPICKAPECQKTSVALADRNSRAN